MATGTVNSQNQAADAVLRSGERHASTVEALADRNSKVYLHRFPGAQFVMPDGLALVFAGGRYVTNRKEEIAQLDSIANKGSSMIYTEDRADALAAAKSQENQAAGEAAALSKTAE